MAKKSKQSDFGAKEILAAVAGFGVIVGCLCAWHFWHMDGFWAVLVAFLLGGGLLSVAFKQDVWS